MKLQLIEKADFSQVLRIYQQGIKTGFATFETVLPSWEKWNHKYLTKPRLGIFVDKELAGWAGLSPVSSRAVYSGVAEVSIYIDQAYRGQGLGKQLLKALIEASEAEGIYSLQSSIMPENIGSHRLHLACGFREIGYKEKIAKLHGEWRDNILFERRSPLF